MNLSELTASGKIKAFSDDLISKRLFSMGCRTGDSCEYILSCGNRCEYKIGETLVAIKRSDGIGIFTE